jgi:hypothetical protein
MAKSIFNINKQHVVNVASLLKVRDVVIVHGDGHMFASNNNETTQYIDDETGELVTMTNAVYGSNHHRRYNAGYKDSEATARAGYRAIFKKGDEAPKSVKDIEDSFVKQANDDLVASVVAKPVVASNIYKFDVAKDEDSKPAINKKA